MDAKGIQTGLDWAFLSRSFGMRPRRWRATLEKRISRDEGVLDGIRVDAVVDLGEGVLGVPIEFEAVVFVVLEAMKFDNQVKYGLTCQAPEIQLADEGIQVHRSASSYAMIVEVPDALELRRNIRRDFANLHGSECSAGHHLSMGISSSSASLRSVCCSSCCRISSVLTHPAGCE